MDDLLQALKAAADPTRLRILVAVRDTELTVGELCRVLEQSQPRVSRHLKLLADAGLLRRHADGTSAFYRLASMGLGRSLSDAIQTMIEDDNPVLQRDADRLGAIRRDRAEEANRYFEEVASQWDRVRRFHVADEHVEAAMLDAVVDMDLGELVDIGTGTGRVLEVFGPAIRSGLGLDLSSKMLSLARSRLDELGLRHCAVRKGNAYDIDLDSGSVDIAVLHHVLHFLDDPAACIAQAARILRPSGRLLIVDFGPHDMEELRDDYAHRRLGYADAEVSAWCTDSGLVDITASHLDPITPGATRLPVTLWVATQGADIAASPPLKAAS